MRFFDPLAEIEVHSNFLPHWQQPGATYSVTFHLADSIPDSVLMEWKSERAAWLIRYPKPWTDEIEREYHKRFSARIDRRLDEGHGAASLRLEENREPLIATLRHGEGDLYAMHAWVIMPNHVHALVSLLPPARLELVVGAWKSISARNINRLIGRTGPFWQEDYFDRMVRDAEHFFNCARYIRLNPEKAHLKPGEYELYESEFVRQP